MSRRLANGSDINSEPLSNIVFHDCIKGLIEAIDERTQLERDRLDYIQIKNGEANNAFKKTDFKI
jgi:hypothetical protein